MDWKRFGEKLPANTGKKRFGALGPRTHTLQLRLRYAFSLDNNYFVMPCRLGVTVGATLARDRDNRLGPAIPHGKISPGASLSQAGTATAASIRRPGTPRSRCESLSVVPVSAARLNLCALSAVAVLAQQAAQPLLVERSAAPAGKHQRTTAVIERSRRVLVGKRPHDTRFHHGLAGESHVNSHPVAMASARHTSRIFSGPREPTKPVSWRRGTVKM